MSISVIRPYTQADDERVFAAAQRFCDRHGINDYGDAVDAVNVEIELDRTCHVDSSIARNWQRVLCRALRVPYDRRVIVAHGHIGLSV